MGDLVTLCSALAIILEIYVRRGKFCIIYEYIENDSRQCASAVKFLRYYEASEW